MSSKWIIQSAGLVLFGVTMAGGSAWGRAVTAEWAALQQLRVRSARPKVATLVAPVARQAMPSTRMATPLV